MKDIFINLYLQFWNNFFFFKITNSYLNLDLFVILDKRLLLNIKNDNQLSHELACSPTLNYLEVSRKKRKTKVL